MKRLIRWLGHRIATAPPVAKFGFWVSAGAVSLMIALFGFAGLSLSPGEFWPLFWLTVVLFFIGLCVIVIGLVFTPPPELSGRPEIVAGDPVKDLAALVWLASVKSIGGSPHLCFVGVPFANVSESSDEAAILRDATATIRLFGQDQLLDWTTGRWRELSITSMDQRLATIGREDPMVPLTLAPNGHPHVLDVVAWVASSKRRDNSCRLVREPLANVVIAGPSGYWATEGRYRVEITLHGVNLNRSPVFRYDLVVPPLPEDYPEDQFTPGPVLTPVRVEP